MFPDFELLDFRSHCTRPMIEWSQLSCPEEEGGSKGSPTILDLKKGMFGIFSGFWEPFQAFWPSLKKYMNSHFLNSWIWIPHLVIIQTENECQSYNQNFSQLECKLIVAGIQCKTPIEAVHANIYARKKNNLYKNFFGTSWCTTYLKYSEDLNSDQWNSGNCSVATLHAPIHTVFPDSGTFAVSISISCHFSCYFCCW